MLKEIDGLHVCHRCDNPPCVNPAHLFLGTAADNMADRISKGRPGSPGTRGEAHGMRKLTVPDVRMIRASDLPARSLATALAVSPGTINLVRARKIWRDVT